jgi:hypothetical protein
MTEVEAFAESVALRASSALSKRHARRELFSIGGLSFQLIAPEGKADHWLGRAFLERPSGPTHITGPASHRLFVWDGTNSEALPPPPPWIPTALEPLGVVGSHSNDAVRCAVDIHTDSLIVYNFARNSSHTWYPSIVELPAWARASPFRVVLSWLCNRHGMQIVHGAAVAIDGRAVLLAGTGGAGKSTTALACALAGLDYLGDDYCAVEPAAGKVHMVYRTAKLFKPTLNMIPSLAAWIDNRDRIEEEKGVIFLQPDDVSLVRSAALSAILLPRIGVESSTTFYPATRDEAIKAILPSTIGGLMGGTSVTPRLIMELVRSVPAFHLALGTDLKAVTDTVASRLMAA